MLFGNTYQRDALTCHSETIISNGDLLPSGSRLDIWPAYLSYETALLYPGYPIWIQLYAIHAFIDDSEVN